MALLPSPSFELNSRERAARPPARGTLGRAGRLCLAPGSRPAARPSALLQRSFSAPSALLRGSGAQLGAPCPSSALGALFLRYPRGRPGCRCPVRMRRPPAAVLRSRLGRSLRSGDSRHRFCGKSGRAASERRCDCSGTFTLSPGVPSEGRRREWNEAEAKLLPGILPATQRRTENRAAVPRARLSGPHRLGCPRRSLCFPARGAAEAAHVRSAAL